MQNNPKPGRTEDGGREIADSGYLDLILLCIFLRTLLMGKNCPGQAGALLRCLSGAVFKLTDLPEKSSCQLVFSFLTTGLAEDGSGCAGVYSFSLIIITVTVASRTGDIHIVLIPHL